MEVEVTPTLVRCGARVGVRADGQGKAVDVSARDHAARPAALVTGGARRIGRAIAEDLARDGHPVAIHCHRSHEDGERLVGTIRDAGGRAALVCGDLADLEGLGALVEAAAGALGPIGLLVNNASRFEEDGLETLTPAGLEAHLAVNLSAPCLLASAFARRLPADRAGLIVNVVDQRVLRPTPLFFSYALSKAGLWWATQTMAQALAPRIRVVAIGPGPTLPSLRQNPEDFGRQTSAVPLGRGADLAEFGRTIRWIRDTPSVTGQFIALDGGQHLAWQTPDVYGVRE